MNTILSREARQGLGDWLRHRATHEPSQSSLSRPFGWVSAIAVLVAAFAASWFLAALVSAAGAR